MPAVHFKLVFLLLLASVCCCSHYLWGVFYPLIQKVFFRGVPNLMFFFCFFFLGGGGLVDEGTDDPNITVNGPSTIQISLLMGHHPPASETPFKWPFAGWPMKAQN